MCLTSVKFSVHVLISASVSSLEVLGGKVTWLEFWGGGWEVYILSQSCGKVRRSWLSEGLLLGDLLCWYLLSPSKALGKCYGCRSWRTTLWHYFQVSLVLDVNVPLFTDYSRNHKQRSINLGLGRRGRNLCSVSKLIFTNFFFKISYFMLVGGWSLHNAVMGFAIHQHESATSIHVSPHPETLPTSLPTPIPLGYPRAPSVGALLHALNLHWAFVFIW